MGFVMLGSEGRGPGTSIHAPQFVKILKKQPSISTRSKDRELYSLKNNIKSNKLMKICIDLISISGL